MKTIPQILSRGELQKSVVSLFSSMFLISRTAKRLRKLTEVGAARRGLIDDG
jgi:hypothetical protein